MPVSTAAANLGDDLTDDPDASWKKIASIKIKATKRKNDYVK